MTIDNQRSDPATVGDGNVDSRLANLLERAESAEFALNALRAEGSLDEALAAQVEKTRADIEQLKQDARRGIQQVVEQAQELKAIAQGEADNAYEQVRKEAESRARILLHEASQLRSLAHMEANGVRAEAEDTLAQAQKLADEILLEANEWSSATRSEQHAQADDGFDAEQEKQHSAALAAEAARILEAARTEAKTEMRRAWELAHERITAMEYEAQERVAALRAEALELSLTISEHSPDRELVAVFSESAATSETVATPSVETDSGFVFPAGTYFNASDKVADTAPVSLGAAALVVEPEQEDLLAGKPTPSILGRVDAPPEVPSDEASTLTRKVFQRRRMTSEIPKPGPTSDLLERAQEFRSHR